MMTSCMNLIAYGITLASTSWLLFFMMFGGTDPGKSWFGHLASNFFQHAKEGVPLMTLAFPILLSGSVCMLLLTRKAKNDNSQLPTTSNYRKDLYLQSLSRRIPSCFRRPQQQCYTSGGDTNFQKFATWFIFVPSLCFVTGCIYRHVHGKELSDDDFYMEVGNSFGVMALVIMSYFLIPVSKQSPILKLLGWSPVHAIQLHIWSGRLIFGGIVLHGGCHMYRWKYLALESLWGIMIPPLPCWTLSDTDFEPTCVDEDSDCSCYDHFRNFTGFLALVTLIVIAITSLNYVRRNHYNLFYKAHVLMAPLMIITALLHYNKGILYIAPSILYYAASSAPVMMESYWQKKTKQQSRKCYPCLTSGGTKIASIETIKSEGRPCVSITFEATPDAIEQFYPGQYVNLSCPEISSISHPFTINQVPSLNQVRVIFRVMGSFTRDLAHRLEHYQQQGSLPKIQLDGYHGSHLRNEQILQHDMAVLVAGGIGITPFLSLLHEVYDMYSNSSEYQQEDGNDMIIMNNQTKKEVVLHWVCRDTSLIEYVKKEYFTPLLQRMEDDQKKKSANKQNFQIKIVIHKTGQHAQRNMIPSSGSYTDLEQQAGLGDHENEDTRFGKMIYMANDHDEVDNNNDGLPFAPSKFAAGSKETIVANMIAFLSFSSIVWVGLAVSVYLYRNVQHEDEVTGRGWVTIAIIAIAVVIGGISNVIMDKINNLDDCSSSRSVGVDNIRSSGSRGSDWWKKSKLSDITDEEDEDSEVEIELLKSSAAPTARNASAGNSTTQTVTVEESEGHRPSAHQFLKCIEKSTSPGIFSCGPTTMMKELRDAAEVQYSMRIQHRICGDTPQIPIYEEAFEM